MRKLLNTVYITNDKAYLSLYDNNLVCTIEGTKALQMPLDNIENIVCFSYLGCSPALMGKCVERQIPINFISPHGKFWAKICGETKGNVFLRVAQIDRFQQCGLELAKNQMVAKFANNVSVIKRTLHDQPSLKEDAEIVSSLKAIQESMIKASSCDSKEILLGIEGNCATRYFSIFPKLILNKTLQPTFTYRNKRPPLDPVNALLSFFYTLATADCASALETVGLDSYIGFYHTMRSGRASLACDMVEEFRGLVERFVLTMVNLKVIDLKDFDCQITGAVWIGQKGKKKLLEKWQERKRKIIYHRVIKEKVPVGLIPYVQANLLAKYIRGETAEYIPFLSQL